MKQRVNIDPIDNKKNEVNNISEDSGSSQLNETIKGVKNQVENLQNSNTNVIDFITDKDDLDTMFDKLFEIMKPFLAAKTFKELKIFNNFDDNLKDKVLKDIYNMFIDEIFKKILEKYPKLSEQLIEIIFSVVQSLSKYANNGTKEGELSELNIEEIIQNSIKSKIDIFSLDIINTYKKQLDDIINNVTNKTNIDLTDPIAISSYNSIIWCEIKKSADTKYLDLLVKNGYKVDYQENIAKNSCTTGLERNINFYLKYNEYDKLENISKLLNLIKKQKIDVDLYKIFKDCFKNCFKNEITYYYNKSDNIKTLIDCFKKNNIDLNIKEVFQELFEENIQNGRRYIDKLAGYAKLVGVYLDFNKDFIQNYFISEFKKVFNWNEFTKKIEQYLENGIFIDYNEAFQLYIDKTCDIEKIIINEESDYLSLWKKEINKIITFIKSKGISFDIQKIYQFELEKSLQSGIGGFVEKIIKIAESDGISLNFGGPNIIDFCENGMIKILSKYGFPLNKFPVIDNRKIFELVKSYGIKVDYNKIYKEALTISGKTNTKILFSIIKYMEENNIVFEIDLKKILKERLLEEINNGESNCAGIIIEYLDENNIKFDYNSSDFKTSLQTGTEKAFKRKNCQDIKYLLEFSDLKGIILEFLTPNIINSCPTFLLEKYTNLPENLLSQFKNNKDFWDIGIEKDILTIIQHYSEIPENFYTEEEKISHWIKYIDKIPEYEYIHHIKSLPLWSSYKDKIALKMEDNLQNEDICQKYYSYNFLFKINCLNLRHIATCKFFLDEDEFNKIKKFLNNNNCDPYKLIIDSIIQIDPSLERLFNNPQKLGKLKYIVIQNLIKYIKQKNEETNKNNDQIMKEIKNKLDKIKRIFSSCDYSIIDRRSLFLDQYLPERDSKYKLFVDEIIKLTQSKNININEATELVVRRDFEEILVLSGSEELKKYYLRRLEMPIKKYKTSGLEGITQDLSSFFFGENGEFFEDDNIDYNIDKEEELKIKSNLKRMKEVVIEADKYNRELYENLKQAKTKEDFVDLAIPFETSVSQVGPPDVTLSILDTGTLCDALLGEMAFFQENNFGSHVCTTKKIQKLSNKNLSERLQSYGNPHGHNVNRIYGKILINDNVIYGLNGDKNSSFSMGIAHQCIHLGIPSTEITAIIINNRGSIDFNDLLNSQKKAIAINGFFIPVIHEMTEKILFSPEEFDQMKVFYHDLYYKGYSMDIIDAVYSYYLKPSVPESNSIVVKSPKHKIVMDAAFEYEKNNPDQKLFDMVQLVEFLNTNHLNTKSTDWYEKNSHNFPELLKSVKEFTLDKRIKSIKETFFIKRSAPGKRVEVNPDNKIMKKFIRQLEDLGISKGSKNYYKYLDIVNQILFRKFKKNSEKLDIQSIIKIQKTLINTKKRSLRNIWGRMCKKYPNYEKYKDKICPMFIGSIGRMESGFDSDNDFVIVVDDRNMTQDQISEVSNIIEKIILNIRDNWEGSGGIDFGKFNKGGKGIVPMTKISSFSLDLNNFSGFHEIEPTSMSSTCPFFKDSVQQKLREDALKLYFENEFSQYYDSVAQVPLEIKSMKGVSFIESFNTLYNSLGTGKMLENLKISLQRTINFKIDFLIFRLLKDKKELKEQSGSLPAHVLGSGGKIDFLIKNNIFTPLEGEIVKELSAFAFRLRCIGELLEITKDNGKKVNLPQYLLNYDEREKLFSLLNAFKEKILFK